MDVCITEIGSSKFGKYPEQNIRELFAKTVLNAFEDSNIFNKKIGV